MLNPMICKKCLKTVDHLTASESWCCPVGERKSFGGYPCVNRLEDPPQKCLHALEHGVSESLFRSEFP